MKASRLKIVVIILIVLVLIALGVAVGARRWPPSTTTQERGQLKATDTLPPVTSHIKGIEVVSAFVDADGLLNITVVNKTGKAIVGIGISSGTMTYTDDNGLTEDNPKPLIVPNGNYTLMPSVSNFQTNKPIHISVALFDDGTEDGDKAQMKNIHEQREREKVKRSHEKTN